MQMLTVFQRELKLGFRNSWTYSFLILFSIFTGAILLLHSSVSSIEGYTNMTGTLMNMTLYLLPLITLLLGSFSITAEKEDGHWGLLATYPLSSVSFFFGKWLGLAIILTTIIFFSFGISGILISIGGQAMNTETFIFFLAFSVLLALTYLSIAFLIGALSKNRWQALIGAIAVWFITIVIWPLLMISLLTQLPSYKLVQPTLQVLTILNPAEFIRVFSMMRLGAGSAFGADYDALITWALSNNGLIIFIIMLIIYVFVTLFISSWIWNRGDKYGAD
ncbi:MAG: ABC transporter permease subunit [Bacilli bacterium]|nr:ABC transporter permease subunit [Bacilli bacterium]